MLAGKIHHLSDLGFRNLMAEHPDNGEPLLVHGQHDFKGLSVVQPEKPFQHMHDKFHRREIVVQQQDLVKRRSLGLDPCLCQQSGIAVAVLTILVGHPGRVRSLQMQHHRLSVGQREFHHQPGQDYIIPAEGVKRGRSTMTGRTHAEITTIGFDADDTLWHNEQFFRITQDRFAALLSSFAERDHLEERLLAAERRNLGRYGFGVKGFVLSMIETAIEVTEDRVPARIIRELIEAGQDMLAHPIHLLPHARETVTALANDFRVLLITKGDLLDQERKLAQSGLGEFFDGVEIVSDKSAQVYHDIFARHGDGAETAMMVGNSLRSDVIPVLEAGGWGIYVPHGLTWALEHAEPPVAHPRYRELPDLGALPPALALL